VASRNQHSIDRERFSRFLRCQQVGGSCHHCRRGPDRSGCAGR
jgi:hypothetical protein